MNKIDNARLLLASVRKADFAHAGGREAVDIVLQNILRFLKNKTTFDITGIDIDKAALEHAKLHYPNINFIECNVADVSNKFKKQTFDLIYLFNVFFAFPQQKNILKKFAEIIKIGGLLVIFDYTCDVEVNLNIKDLAGTIPIKPVNLTELKKWLKIFNWKLLEINDLTNDFIRWYEDFLKLIQTNKENLLKEFSQKAYSTVQDTFSVLLENLKNKKMKGTVVYVTY